MNKHVHTREPLDESSNHNIYLTKLGDGRREGGGRVEAGREMGVFGFLFLLLGYLADDKGISFGRRFASLE